MAADSHSWDAFLFWPAQQHLARGRQRAEVLAAEVKSLFLGFLLSGALGILRGAGRCLHLRACFASEQCERRSALWEDLLLGRGSWREVWRRASVCSSSALLLLRAASLRLVPSFARAHTGRACPEAAILWSERPACEAWGSTPWTPWTWIDTQARGPALGAVSFE